jgi:hypothetical protein
LWNNDGTIGLLVPLELLRGICTLSMTFQENLGAEAPCIAQNATEVTEGVPVGPIRMGPPIRRSPQDDESILAPERPVLDLAPKLQAIFQA